VIQVISRKTFYDDITINFCIGAPFLKRADTRNDLSHFL
jgi:hypothetical protein